MTKTKVIQSCCVCDLAPIGFAVLSDFQKYVHELF